MRQATTQRDVARHAGVSQRLVSAALHNNAPGIRLGATTRERVLRAARELGYRPNVVARSLVAGRTHALGFVIQNLTNPVYGELTNYVHSAAAGRGYDVMIALSEDEPAHLSPSFEPLLARRVDGLIIWGSLTQEEYEAPSRLRDAGPNLVVLGAVPPDERMSYVAVDRASGVAEAVAHLARLGHIRIGYAVTGAHPAPGGHQLSKFAGFLRSMEAHGLDPHRVWSSEHLPGEEDPRRLVLSVANEIAHSRDLPSALIAGGDALALALLGAFARVGIRVPEDVAVIGYDDVPAAAACFPALTTVAQPTRELAEEGIRMLLDLIADPTGGPLRTILRPRLLIRESCGGTLSGIPEE